MDGGDEEFSSVAQQRSDQLPTLPPKYSDDDAAGPPDVTVEGMDDDDDSFSWRKLW